MDQINLLKRQMNNNSDYIDLSDPVGSFSISYVVHPEFYVVGVACNPDSVWIPSVGNFLLAFSNFI